LINITIDGKSQKVKAGDNLLAACIALGYDLPFFCYHPAMGSVGACRQCAVKKYKDANDTKGRIIMSCMEPVAEGMIISIEDPEAKDFRKNIVEGLMLNHPHDCPVCDEGGECHLQDMTVMTGHTYRRSDFKKRTHNNQYLGSFIHHEMNRCIQCYRCVRFYRDYAGGTDFNVFASRDNVYFGRYEEGALENEFSGNLVEVCPTGVFTDKTARQHFTRKWDLTGTPSICTHCSVGCNIIAGERYGSLRRIMNRYNGVVNGYFLCDRGRFGYEFVNSDNRIIQPSVQLLNIEGHENVPAADTREILKSYTGATDKLIGIGSPRASLESNYALMKCVGKENFYAGVSAKEFALTKLALNLLTNGFYHSPSLGEIGKADAIIILGEDITNTAPMMALAVRQAARRVPVMNAVNSGIPEWHDNAIRDQIQEMHGPVINAVPYTTKLDDISGDNFKAGYNDIALLGFEIASVIDKEARDEKSSSKNETDKSNPLIEKHESAKAKGITGSRSIKELADNIADKLKDSKHPVVITGLQSGSPTMLHAASNLARALNIAGKDAGLCIILPESNSMGLAMMDAKEMDKAIDLVGHEQGITTIILENDVYRRTSAERADILLRKSKLTIVVDHIHTPTTSKAQVVLPAATFAEAEGTFVNFEGRAQRFYKAIPPDNSPLESWRILSDYGTLDEIVADMANEIPYFRKITEYMPDADFREIHQKIARQTKRYSGRTAMNANINVSEQNPPDDADSPLEFSMEGTQESKPSSLVPYYWKPGWNSYQAVNFYLDKPDGSMQGGDPGIRLIEKNQQPGILYFEPQVPQPEPGDDNWMTVPVHRIFGSEELSSLAPGVEERIPQPFILMNEKSTEILKKREGDMIIIDVNNVKAEFRIQVDAAIPSQTLGISAMLPGMEYMELPAEIRI